MNLNNKKPAFCRKSLTLTELIIAIVLLGVVFLTATNLEISSRRFYIESDKYTQTALDIAPAMERITKSIGRAIGDINNQAIIITPPSTISIKYDYNLNAMLDGADISDGFSLNANRIRYYPNFAVPGTFQDIAYRVVSLTFTRTVDPLVINVVIVARYDPTIAAGPENPEVTLTTGISQHSVSQN